MANTTKNKQETFKVSDLHEIKTLDDQDLFLMSDKENGKYYTKSLTFKKLISTISNNDALIQAIANDPELVQKILDSQSELDQKIQEKVNEKIQQETVVITGIYGGNATNFDA